MNKRYLHWEQKDLMKRFIHDLPPVYQAALQSENVSIFKKQIVDYYCCSPLNARLCDYDLGNGRDAVVTIRPLIARNGRDAVVTIRPLIARLCEYDGQTVRDFSTENEVPINTISLLYSFLRDGITTGESSINLLTDLYHIFLHAGKDPHPQPVPKIKKWTKHWVSGLQPAVLQVREDNKQRIIKKLVYRIERRSSPHQHYFFPEPLNYEEKVRMVEAWWNNYRFHLHSAIKSPEELNLFLDNSLSSETMLILQEAKKKDIPFFITPYFLSLLDITGNTFDDATLRAYMLYTKELVETFGEIKAWEREDKIVPGKANAAGWIVPEGKNIHRRYPDVAIFIPDSGGRACGGLCASCQRMYDFQSERLNFNMKDLLPQESWPLKLKKLMNYFEEDTQIRDILITGGDALMSRNATLAGIFDAVYKMALQKKTENENRLEGEKYAEIQRIRLGTRILAYLPMRIDDELIAILKEFRDKASKIGIQQFIIQTHFQTPLEMTKETKEAIKRISTTGWVITNQLVFNVAASRRGHTAILRKTLIDNGVIPYYTFIVKGFHENYAVYAPIARLMQERMEEKVSGLLSREQQDAFVEIVSNNIPFNKKITGFLRENKRSFVATDRSVLNLPGIGKSMTFQLVGITPEGKRILRFDHDTSRKHSPVIQNTGAIYITENKSILAYLKQLEQLGEDVADYQSIWGYTEGVTEPKFKLYEYPDFQFRPTERLNHFRSPFEGGQ